MVSLLNTHRVLGLALLLTAAQACTRVLYVGPDDRALTGRTMDWSESTQPRLYVAPRGMSRHGLAGNDSLVWTSNFGSLVIGLYDLGAADGLNEKGLAGNVLYLPDAQYGDPNHSNKPRLSVLLLLQYALDSFASVAEAVEGLRARAFTLVGTILPNGKPALGHVSLSDSTGDSAIIEFVNDGQLTIYHSKEYQVMTNSPPFDEQLALAAYWSQMRGRFLPGTSRPSERLARALYYLRAVPKSADKAVALAQLRGILRAVSVPLGMVKVDSPEASSTQYTTIIDKTALRLYFENTLDPASTWVDMGAVDLSPGAAVLSLDWHKGWSASDSPLAGRAGDVGDLLRPVGAADMPLMLGGDGSCDELGACVRQRLGTLRRRREEAGTAAPTCAS